MLRRFTRKRWIAALAAVAALVVAGAALAYFTAGGSGTGKATVGTVTSGVDIKGDVASGQYLFPGGDAVTVPITVTNNGQTAVNVGTVTLKQITADSAHAGCVLSAFSMDPVDVKTTAAPGATIGPFNGSLKMNDTGVSQDACQGASLTLTFASTAGS